MDLKLGFLDKLLKAEIERTTASFGSNSCIIIPYTPISMIRRGPYVHVRGLVSYSSGLEAWDNYDGTGCKMCFDLADETGMIRIFVWNEAAKDTAELIKPGQTIGLMNLTVNLRGLQYNNLDHPYRLEWEDGLSQVIQLKKNSIQAIEDIPHFLPFEKIRRFPPNQYFSVTGKVVDIGPVEEGVGMERGTKYLRRFIYIKNNEGDRLKIVSWNECIPVLSEAGISILEIGTCLSVIRAKWVSEWENVNASGARIEIDGKRVR